MVGIATLILSSTLLPILDFFGGADKAKGYQMSMGVMAPSLFMFLFCFSPVKERIQPAVPSKHALKSDLKDVKKRPVGYASCC